MIDTDKYEGHTPADQWTIYKMGVDKPYHAVRFGQRGLDLELEFGADARLIADAPILLQALMDERAEVKRLRRVDKTTSKYLSFALSLLTDEQDCEYTHFVGGLCTHYCCPHGDEEE